MSTTPTIFNEKVTPYTVVGGRQRDSSAGLSAVVLNRKGHYQRRAFFQELEKSGFDKIISIESCAVHYDIEELSNRFPFVHFILPEKEINTGEQINLAAFEINSPLFYVLRSDLKIIAGGTAKRMAERLTENGEGNTKAGYKRLCTVPVIMNSRYETMPTLVAPVTHKRKMQTVFLEPKNEGFLTLYPFDGIGIYDRERFILTGGFDETLKSEHWQFMDFGFRAHLWGEEIALSLQLKLFCDGIIPPENYTAEGSYSRFYLKNLAPVLRGDSARLPLYLFPYFLLKSKEDVITAWEEFNISRNWVEKNKLRWKCDAGAVAGLWDKSSDTENPHHEKTITDAVNIMQSQELSC